MKNFIAMFVSIVDFLFTIFHLKTRKDGSMMIGHSLRVGIIALKIAQFKGLKFREQLITFISALLHDALEDTSAAMPEIAAIGNEYGIANLDEIVLALSYQKYTYSFPNYIFCDGTVVPQKYEDKVEELISFTSADKDIRKKRNIARWLYLAENGNNIIAIVKMADIIDNLANSPSEYYSNWAIPTYNLLNRAIGGVVGDYYSRPYLLDGDFNIDFPISIISYGKIGNNTKLILQKEGNVGAVINVTNTSCQIVPKDGDEDYDNWGFLYINKEGE